MAEKAETIGKLSAAAKKTAVAGFARFYVRKYQTTGTDVFADIDLSGHVADINGWLMENSSFMPDQLLDGVIAARDENFVALLKVLKTKFNTSGQPLTAWDAWYDQLVGSVPQGK